MRFRAARARVRSNPPIIHGIRARGPAPSGEFFFTSQACRHRLSAAVFEHHHNQKLLHELLLELLPELSLDNALLVGVNWERANRLLMRLGV